MNKKIKIANSWQTAWHHLRRSPFQSLAAIMVMFLNIFILTFLGGLVFALFSIVSYFRSRPEVTAFLKDEVTAVQVQQLQQKLSMIQGVKEVRFVSKEEALKIYKEQNKDNPLSLEMVNAEMLPASLEVSALAPDYLKEVASFLENEKGLIKEIVFPRDVVEKVSFWAKVLWNGSLIAGGILTLVSLVVIIVIIGMKINSHRSEVEILRSLGATNFYIQSPFLIEGAFYGGTGFLLSFSFFTMLIFLFSEKIAQLASFFAPIQIYPSVRIAAIFTVVLFLFALLTGVLAAFIATRRYLKKR